MRAVLSLLLLLPGADALACGQSTHVWIGIEAVHFLPDGPLKDLLARDDLFAHRVNGAMFPDGGYSPLTQDGYGETAHWEPFQTAYLAWIAERWDPPYDGEAAPHVAFLMGLAAHGIADQVYDGVYLTRSLLYDGEATWQQHDVDLATDIGLTARAGPMPQVDDVVPYDAMVEVFERYGQPTDPKVMRTGQASLRLAVAVTSANGQEPDKAAAYEAQFPWANANIDDPAVPCSPACIQPAVAAYWQTLWARLHDTYDPHADAVFATWPASGSFGHPTDASSIEAQVSLGLSRAVDLGSLSPESVVVTDSAGAPHPVDFRMYYRDDSNVMNVWPLEDWAADEDYTLTLAADVTSFDGVRLGAPWSMTFSTRPPPPTPDPEPGDDPAPGGDPAPPDPAPPTSGGGGGCATGSAAPGWLALAALVGLRRRR